MNPRLSNFLIALASSVDRTDDPKECPTCGRKVSPDGRDCYECRKDREAEDREQEPSWDMEPL